MDQRKKYERKKYGRYQHATFTIPKYSMDILVSITFFNRKNDPPGAEILSFYKTEPIQARYYTVTYVDNVTFQSVTK